MKPDRLRVVTLLGMTQILAWGCSYYMPAVLAGAIAADRDWSLPSVFGGLSWALLMSGGAAPRIGHWIDRKGGAPVLATGSLLFAIGLATVGLSDSLALYYLGWTFIGFGMGCGLYDAGFATVGRLYGIEARGAITGLTLFAGFASTLLWPVITFLEHGWGWRDACFVMAFVHLAVALPLHALVLPRLAPLPPQAEPLHKATGGPTPSLFDRNFLLMMAMVGMYGFIPASFTVFLLQTLREFGMTPAAAVAIGVLIGPSQVGARLLDLFAGRQLHPAWTARIAAATMLVSVLLLLGFGAYVAAFATILYGAGNGVMTIARGALPLALYGAPGYAIRVGILARPLQISQAVTPFFMAWIIEDFGVRTMLVIVAVAATCCLTAVCLIRRSPGPA